MSTKITGSRLVIIFIASLTLLSVAGISALSGNTERLDTGAPEPALQTARPAFTLMTRRIVAGGDGRERQLSTQQRFQRSDGIFKVIHSDYKPDGTPAGVQTIFGYQGLGVFRLDQPRQRLVFVGPQQEEAPENIEQYLRAHPLFAGAESVQGVSAIVWRKGAPGASEYSEELRAPALGGLMIKRVTVSARGRETVEPVTIETGEPVQNHFDELFSYPVDYSDFERRVAESESRSELEVAGFMRELLARMRQLRP